MIISVGVAGAQSGACGNDLTWELSDSTLTISGTGAMKNYQFFSPPGWKQHRLSIKSVVINDGVTTIGNYAFEDCSSLTSVTIPNSVTSFGTGAFKLCSSLSSFTIPNGVTNVGTAVFSGCSNLTSVTIGSGVTGIRPLTFEDCSSLTSVTIPNSVTSIESDAFSGCSSLTSIAIPNSVTNFDGNPFTYCSSLTSIDVDVNNPNYCSVDGVLFTKDKATFVAYPGAKQVIYTIPNSVTSIGSTAFSGCSSLISVTIPNSVTSIGSAAFSGCSSLTSITVPNSVTSIGSSAFSGCSSLTSITVSNSLTSIEMDVFSYCTSLTSITIPNSVTSIGFMAFSGCSSLTSVTISSGMKSIEEYAFSSCEKLVDVYCYATTLPTVSNSSFENYNASLYVPCESKESYANDAVWGKFTKLQCISSDSVETDNITVTPAETEVNVTWPSVSGAASYELVVKDKDGDNVCTLVFNANGQLNSITSQTPAPQSAPAQTKVAGFSFTITGLNSGTNYDLTITSKDSNGVILQTETVSFSTTDNNGGQTGLENLTSVQGEDKGRLILRNGQVLILRNGKTYTMTGLELR